MCSTRKFDHYKYTNLIEKYLGHRNNIPDVVVFLRQTPEILDIFSGELTAAINLFNRSKNELSKKTKELYINSYYLAKTIGKHDLPSWEMIVEENFGNQRNNSELLISTFKELNGFEFIEDSSIPLMLSGELFVGVYRTYVLNLVPQWRKAKVQVASSVEEMLAFLALNGIQTLLFSAIKHWIFDYEIEGFSHALARKVYEL